MNWKDGLRITDKIDIVISSEELRLDEFFQRLREIQKKERNISGLAKVGDNFYKDVYNYLDKLMMKIGNNPFSLESYLLRDARRIAAEICERREHKIANSALLNIQRTNGLFNENSEKFESHLDLPPNLTPEEEKLYFSISKSLFKYRNEMMGPLKSIKDNSSLNKSKKMEEMPEEPISPAKNLNKDNIKKSSLHGIEHDIKSFQAYENHESIIKDIERVKKESKSKENGNPIKMVMALEALPSIMGVDNNIYGPLSPQDIITMPEQNAMILINNNKGRFIQKYKEISYK